MKVDQVDSTTQTFVVDIEPTNACNADCYFCPRDQTPHQGLMSDENFDHALSRVIELQAEIMAANPDKTLEVHVNFCGLGEPLLNKRTPRFIRDAKAAGFTVSLSSNGALLDAARLEAVLEAGVDKFSMNVGELDDDYEAIYGLPFETTLENVERLLRDTADRAEVQMVLVDHAGEPQKLNDLTEFWTARGAKEFKRFSLINRGGALNFENFEQTNPEVNARAMELVADHPNQPVCIAPFLTHFIGYDGNYYLCCSDWRKEVAIGHVSDTPITSVIAAKIAYTQMREPICKNCNVDPINVLADVVRTGDETEMQEVADSINTSTSALVAGARRLIADSPHEQRSIPKNRTLIPLTVDSI